MNYARRIIILSLVLSLTSLGLAGAQTRRTNTRQNNYLTGQIISRIETDTATFRNTLAGAVDNSRIDDTRREQNINIYLNDFIGATAQLRARFNRRQAVAAD